MKSSGLLIVFLLVSLIATLQHYLSKGSVFQNMTFTSYNNYIIFKQSFFHLINGVDLYTYHLDEYWDLFKYSPTFALLFGFFAWMPDALGLFLWIVLNALSLFVGFRMLPHLDLKTKNLMLLLAMVEMLTSLQNAQSNSLIAGLIILAFALMENQKFAWACLCIALTVYIKLFGLFAFALCLLYPQRWKMTVYSIVIMIVLAALPLGVVSATQLIAIYQSWWHLLQSDFLPSDLSVVEVMRAWFGVHVNPMWILLPGIVLFLLPFLRIKYFTHYYFRLALLAIILIWLVVFNHKAESPTFVIAIAGVVLWFFSTCSFPKWRIALGVLALIFTSLSPTDLFPNFIQDEIFVPFAVKALPCILIYFVALYELVFTPDQFTHS